MKIFGRERETLLIKAVRAVRAKYMDGPGTEMIEIHLRTEGNYRLDLHVPQQLAPELIGQLTDAYEAINPPLHLRHNRQSSWDGAS